MKVVIVGAGHAGVTLAYFFKKAKADVTVLEKDFVGSGETGYSTGIFPYEPGIFEFYKEIEEYTLGYFKPLVYEHILKGDKGQSIYVDGYNYAYYTSIVLEKEGVRFEVMNPFVGFECSRSKILGVKTRRGIFKGDIFIVSAGGSTPFILKDFENLDGVSFRWVRSLLLKPHGHFSRVVFYDDEFVLKPEGEDRIILREQEGVEVEPGEDVVNKTRGVDEDFYTKVADYLENTHPELLDASLERGWSTLCMEARDPVKRSGQMENLFIFAGFGCMGFRSIPVLAKKLIKEVLND